MSTLETWASKRTFRRVPCSGAQAGLAWLVCGAVGCTSFAGLSDSADAPSGDGSVGGSAGGASAPSGSDPNRSTRGAPLPPPSPSGSDASAGGGASVGGSDVDGSGVGNDPGSRSNADGPLPPDAGSPEPGGPGLEDPACMGLALNLDGTNYATIPRTIEDDFTIEAWIQTLTSRDGVSGFYGRALFDADVVGSGNFDDFAATVLNGGLAFAVGNPDITAQGLTPVATGRWTHVAVTRTRSSGQLQILIDGVPDAIVSAPNRNSLSATMTLGLGGSAELVRNFVGSIDEVKIWNVVRNIDQIASDMRTRPDGLEEGLVGYYSFEDASAEETADGSQMGLVATLTGAPTYVPSSALCLR